MSYRSIRLFINQKLVVGNTATLSEKMSHYLNAVMRCTTADVIKCFNASDGEFFAEIQNIDKKQTTIKVQKQIRKPIKEKDIWLLFAPLKKDKTDFVIEKAVELGASKIVPVITARTNSAKVKIERFELQAIEAAEQCERMSVPEIGKTSNLNKLLKEWDASRLLFFMDERRKGKTAEEAFISSRGKKTALLIGPEGGFNEEEKELLNKQPFVINVSLGPRILRAETAATAALAVWQAIAGDWRKS